MSKILVDGAATVNIMPMATFRKLGKGSDDLVKTNMVLKDFEGNTSETQGALNVELTVSSKAICNFSSSSAGRDRIASCSKGIGFTLVVAFCP
jgi:hypothetical protein